LRRRSQGLLRSREAPSLFHLLMQPPPHEDPAQYCGRPQHGIRREAMGRPCRSPRSDLWRRVAGIGHTDVQRWISCWPQAPRSALSSGAQGCLAGHPLAQIFARLFVRAALPSSGASGSRAPDAALLGSSCAGNPSSWAWAFILSSFLAPSATPGPRVPSEPMVIEHFDFLEHFDAHD